MRLQVRVFMITLMVLVLSNVYSADSARVCPGNRHQQLVAEIWGLDKQTHGGWKEQPKKSPEQLTFEYACRDAHKSAIDLSNMRGYISSQTRREMCNARAIAVLFSISSIKDLQSDDPESIKALRRRSRDFMGKIMKKKR